MAAIPVGIGLYELGLTVLAGLGIIGAGVATQATIDMIKARDSANTDAATCDPANPIAPCYCPPRAGVRRRVNHHMSAVSRAYQARITGFTPYHEWTYMGIDFDGFWAGNCTLVEAKAKYEQFLDPETNFKTWRRWYGGRFLPQAMSQNAVAVPKPPVILHWYFMQLPVQMVAVEEFAVAGLPIVCIYRP